MKDIHVIGKKRPEMVLKRPFSIRKFWETHSSLKVNSKQPSESFILMTRHLKMQKDGWAKYIRNFGFK